MNDKPKISVIVPIYKVEKYLRQCVDSLLRQTLADIQIILVDDGSPDSCPQICDEYAERDSRIEVLHKQNGGLLRARISGAELARANYIGFVDSDDYAAPDMFETLYRAAEEHHAQMVCANFWLCSGSGENQKYSWPFPEGLFSGERLKNEFYPIWFEDRKIGHVGLVKAVWCKLFDRELLRDVYTRVEPQVNIGEDLITTYAVAALAERIYVMPNSAVYYYRKSDISMMDAYWSDFYANEAAALKSLTDIPCRADAVPYLKEGLKRYRAYMMYDILYNECKPNRSSSRDERRAIAAAFTGEEAWQRAAKLDVLPGCDTTSRLLRKCILRRRPSLVLATLWCAVQKNKLLKVIKNGK